jgi:hypothetical protein
MTTEKNEETLRAYESKVADLHMAMREHQAYKECFEFEGDVCSTCEELSADIDAAMFDIEEWNRIATYNARYAEFVTRRAAKFGQAAINEQALINAHAWATNPADADVCPPEGWPQAKVVSCDDGVCGRCAGDGVLAHFSHIAKGVCFHCDGSGKCPDYEDEANAAAYAEAQASAHCAEGVDRCNACLAEAQAQAATDMVCAQCDQTTSWATNEYALVPNTLICGQCNRANKEAAAA